MRRVWAGLVCAALWCANAQAGDTRLQFYAYVPPSTGAAQFGPLQAYAEGLGDKAGLQLTAGNAARTKTRVSFQAYDQDFRHTNNVQLPKETILNAGELKRFVAVLPVSKEGQNRYRICATFHYAKTGTKRICGKYIARKL